MSKKKISKEKTSKGKNTEWRKMSNQWKMLLDVKYKIFILFYWKKRNNTLIDQDKWL